MTTKQAWAILEKKAVFGRIPEYWAWCRNGKVLAQRNRQGARVYTVQLGGIRDLEPVDHLPNTEHIGLMQDPDSILGGTCAPKSQ